MYRRSTMILCLAALLSMGSPIYAIGGEPNTTRQEARQEIRQEIRQELRTGSGPGVMKKMIGTRALVTKGTVIAKAGTGFSLKDKNGTTITIVVDDKTKIHRKFWGKGTLDEVQVGHEVDVIGKWMDEGKTQIQALQIRDISIQRRNGVFFGTVSSVSGTGFVMTTKARGNQTVTLAQTTKLTNRFGLTIQSSVIAVGHRVRVIGLWDTKANTITEVTQVRDFDLMDRPTSTPSPTP